MSIKSSYNRTIKILAFTILSLIHIQLKSQEVISSVQVMGGPAWHIFENSETHVYRPYHNFSMGILLSKKLFGTRDSGFALKMGYTIDTKKYTMLFSDTIAWYPKEIDTRFLYGNIPLYIDYRIKLNPKVYTNFSLGMVLGHILKQEQVTINNDGTKEEGFHPKINNESNPFHIALNVGLGYRISNRIELTGISYVKHQLNGNAPYNFDRDVRLTLGIRAGIQFFLK